MSLVQVEKATQKLQALQTKAEEQMDAKDYYGAVTTIAKALSARAFLVSNQPKLSLCQASITSHHGQSVFGSASLWCLLSRCDAAVCAQEEDQVAELEAMEKRARELEALAADDDDEEEEEEDDEEYEDEDAE